MSILRKTSFRLIVLACGCFCIFLGVWMVAGISVIAQDVGDDFTPISDHSEIITAWEGSPHGNTYDVGKGPNTYCSRCHSPQNWDPESRPGIPPNCITCHFAHEEEMRVAETMDFVEEADWVGIGCDTCHEVEGDLINSTAIAWYNPLSGEYDSVATPNELCEMCHVNSAARGVGVDHEIVLGGSAHVNWAGTIGDRRPSYCTDCHDSHTQEALGCADCHEGMSELEGHAGGEDVNALHLDAISCIACHDASGADVAPHPDEAMNGIWTTIERGMDRSGEPTVTVINSHSVQVDIVCDRCHYEGNEWDLPVLDASGQPPEETSD